MDSAGHSIARFCSSFETRFLLAYLDDESYRRRILTQLNRSETRHKLARAIFHGQRGEVRQRYRSVLPRRAYPLERADANPCEV